MLRLSSVHALELGLYEFVLRQYLQKCTRLASVRSQRGKLRSSTQIIKIAIIELITWSVFLIS